MPLRLCAFAMCLGVLAPAALPQTTARELPNHVPPWVAAAHDLGPVNGATELHGLRILLRRPAEREAAFQKLLQEQQDPASPRFHHWLSAQQIGQQFGASDREISAVTHWLNSAGLRVDSVANSRLYVTFHGTVAQTNAAFLIQMHRFAWNGSARLAAVAAPTIPAAIAPYVQAVLGLQQHGLRPAVHARPSYTACYSGDCYYYVTPGDFATIYNINSAYTAGVTGQGQTVAIIGRAQVYAPDITEYEAQTGLPSATPKLVVPSDGVAPPAPNDSTAQTPNDDQTEATLDVQRVFGTSPGAAIDLVASLSTQTEDGIDIAKDYVIDNASALGVKIMTLSFGACEAEVASSVVQADNSLFEVGAAEGLSIFVASGDAGAAGCDAYNSTPPATQVKSPNYLCSSGYVTCMGGTEFNDTADPAEYWSPNNSTTLASALSYIPEGAWNEPESGGDYYAQATGGGTSSVLATPYWQTGPGVPGGAGRYTPDAAFTAAEHDAYYGCYAAGGGDCSANYFEYFYGTSAAAPSMAGVAALLNQKLGKAQGNLNPTLYALANATSKNVFHDATVASSGVSSCAAATPSMCNNSTPAPDALTGGLAGYLLTFGYDLATGWGSLNVANLLADYAGGGPAATETQLSISPGDSFAAGTVATLTANVTSAITISAGTVEFLADGQSIGSAAVTGGVAKLTASTAGVAPATYSVQARYSGTAVAVPSSSSAVVVTLTKAGSATALTASPSSVTPPADVTLTATVSSADGTPTGQVTFYYGTLNLGTETLISGKASLTASTRGLAPGNYAVHAVYGGSSSINGSGSSNVVVTVK